GIFKPHEEKAKKEREKEPDEKFLIEVCGRAVPARNTEDGVVTAGVFEGIGKDGEAVGVEGTGWEGAGVVGGLGQAQHDRGSPCRAEGDGAEGVAENAAENTTLPSLL